MKGEFRTSAITRRGKAKRVYEVSQRIYDRLRIWIEQFIVIESRVEGEKL